MALGGIGFRGVVVNAEVGDAGQEADEVFAAAGPAFADFFLGNVVSAMGHAAAHAAEVEIGAGQSAKPHMQAVAGAGGLVEHLRDGAAAESCLEAVVAALRDGLLEKRLADLPRMGVGEGEGDVRMEGADFLGDGVGVENRRAFFMELGLADARFPGAVHAGQHIKERLIRHGRHSFFVPQPTTRRLHRVLREWR